MNCFQVLQNAASGDVSGSEEDFEAAVHGRKLTKRAHSFDVNHTHQKRTTLEPQQSARQEASGKDAEKSQEVLLSKKGWDPKYQYSQKSSAESLDPSGKAHAFLAQRNKSSHA